MADSKVDNMLKFNIKNVKYAFPDATGGYSGADIVALGGAANLSLERQYSEQEIYADGQIAYIIPSDKGINGTLGLVTLDDDYEIAVGRKIELDGGIASVQQLSSKAHALYFECNGIDEDGQRITLKNWIFEVVSGAPTEAYAQDTENINPQNISMTLKITGVNLKASSGDDDYIDAQGNNRKVTVWTKCPDDTGYDTFDKTVPSPKMKA